MSGKRTVVAVDELRQAYRGVLAGDYRQGPRTNVVSAGATIWIPGSPSQHAVLVIGCIGSAGASTMALALATVAGDARVVECCSVASSGLAGASSAELGAGPNGWVQGSRGPTLIERRGDRVVSSKELPPPSPSDRTWTFLDCSVDADLLLVSPGWLGVLARTVPHVVAVTRATSPGLRRLEIAVGLIGADRLQAVVMGAERRWPRQLEQSVGAATRELRANGRLMTVPPDAALDVHGLTVDPLPATVLTVAADLLVNLKGTHQ